MSAEERRKYFRRMKIDNVHLDTDASGVWRLGPPPCWPHFRRLTVFGATLVAFIGVVVVEFASADEWSAVDAGFVAPPAEYRLIQFGGHDGALLPVSQMATAGIGGVQFFMQSEGYLQSEQAWANVSNNIAEVKGAGLQLWVADNNGCPSGMAGGACGRSKPGP